LAVIAIQTATTKQQSNRHAADQRTDFHIIPY
jgi:hypothetical protein